MYHLTLVIGHSKAASIIVKDRAENLKTRKIAASITGSVASLSDAANMHSGAHFHPTVMIAL